MVINRMRGNWEMLSSGISKLEELTGKKVIGIIPYSEISLPEVLSIYLRFHISPYNAGLLQQVSIQAMAAGTEPSKFMNPFLIKPEGMGKSQIIVKGKSIGSMFFTVFP